jgi:hypothetical protein
VFLLCPSELEDFSFICAIPSIYHSNQILSSSHQTGKKELCSGQIGCFDLFSVPA